MAAFYEISHGPVFNSSDSGNFHMAPFLAPMPNVAAPLAYHHPGVAVPYMGQNLIHHPLSYRESPNSLACHPYVDQPHNFPAPSPPPGMLVANNPPLPYAQDFGPSYHATTPSRETPVQSYVEAQSPHLVQHQVTNSRRKQQTIFSPNFSSPLYEEMSKFSPFLNSTRGNSGRASLRRVPSLQYNMPEQQRRARTRPNRESSFRNSGIDEPENPVHALSRSFSSRLAFSDDEKDHQAAIPAFIATNRSPKFSRKKKLSQKNDPNRFFCVRQLRQEQYFSKSDEQRLNSAFSLSFDQPPTAARVSSFSEDVFRNQPSIQCQMVNGIPKFQVQMTGMSAMISRGIGACLSLPSANFPPEIRELHATQQRLWKPTSKVDPDVIFQKVDSLRNAIGIDHLLRYCLIDGKIVGAKAINVLLSMYATVCMFPNTPIRYQKDLIRADGCVIFHYLMFVNTSGILIQADSSDLNLEYRQLFNPCERMLCLRMGRQRVALAIVCADQFNELFNLSAPDILQTRLLRMDMFADELDFVTNCGLFATPLNGEQVEKLTDEYIKNLEQSFSAAFVSPSATQMFHSAVSVVEKRDHA